ncbi:STAS domain-containing protein [Streptomyces sp. Tu 3180]|uniref:STAS domain-containing protein n=1 Tax=Streptomyces sp. Tu 3180 TaxID=2682611 RepID=UPI001359DC2A|nr:STAS domain-containing protein [Streptomyces sp. Tu 3180]KAF3463474.1 STAS domain-containing protein [Streptomyces sp. Tu 3180]
MPAHHGAPHRPLPAGQTAATEDISVVTLHGDIDHHTIPHVRDHLLFPRGAAAARTVIDLSAVTFIDSSAINAFITAHHAAQRSGGWLRLAGPLESVLHLIRIVGLDGIIPCYPTLHRALAA